MAFPRRKRTHVAARATDSKEPSAGYFPPAKKTRHCEPAPLADAFKNAKQRPIGGPEDECDVLEQKAYQIAIGQAVRLGVAVESGLDTQGTLELGLAQSFAD